MTQAITPTTQQERILSLDVFWAILIIWSNLWVRKYRFGPLEWLWRSLTYWKIQPMKLNN